MTISLSELARRWQTRSVLGVTVESARVLVEWLRSDKDGARLERSMVLPLGADAVLADPAKAGRDLAALLAAAGVRERRCVLTLPAAWALATGTELPDLSGEDLRDFLELRAEREFPVATSDLRLAHCAFDLPGGGRQATLAALPAKRLQAAEQMLATAECNAVSISLALEGCLAGTAPAGLHFLANGGHADLVIAAGGGIAALRTLPAPAPGAGDAEQRVFAREVRITLGRLPEALRREVRQARFAGPREAAESLRTSIADELQRMGLENVATPAGSEPMPAGREAAFLFLRGEPVAFEFVPPRIQRWQPLVQRFDSKRRRWIAAAALALVVLPMLTFFVRSRMESSLQSEWAAMNGQVADLEALQGKIRQFRPWFDPTPQSLQALEGLTAAFPEQPDVWAKSVQLGEDNKITCTGAARSQPVLMAMLERLRSRPNVTAVQVQTVRGENPVLFSFTYKWEGHDAK